MSDLELEQAIKHQQDRLTKVIEQTGEMIASINFLEELYAQAEANTLTLDALEHSCEVFADSGQAYQPWVDQIKQFCHEVRQLPKPVNDHDLLPGSPYAKKLEQLLLGLAAQLEEH